MNLRRARKVSLGVDIYSPKEKCLNSSILVMSFKRKVDQFPPEDQTLFFRSSSLGNVYSNDGKLLVLFETKQE